jgi:hypothetical protein
VLAQHAEAGMRAVEPLALAGAGAAMLTHGTTSSGRLSPTL